MRCTSWPLPALFLLSVACSTSESSNPESAAAFADASVPNGGAPDSGSLYPELPECTSSPLPSTRVNISAIAPYAPPSYEGPAVVESILRYSGSDDFVVSIRLPVDDIPIEVSSGGREFPSFQEGQQLYVNLFANRPGIVNHLVLGVWDEQGQLLVANYGWEDRFLRDGTFRELFGFDVHLEPSCSRSTECLAAPFTFFTATLVTDTESIPLEEQVPLDVTLDDGVYSVVFKGGRYNPGPPTGVCSHTVVGSTIDLTIMRLPNQ